MDSEKRPRGRPPGPKIDDTATLAVVADELLAHPNFARMTAIGRVVDTHGYKTSRDADIRRLMRAWNVDGERLTAEARARRAKRQAEAAAASFVAFTQQVDGFARRLDAWQRQPEVVAFIGQLNQANKAIANYVAAHPKEFEMLETVRRLVAESHPHLRRRTSLGM